MSGFDRDVNVGDSEEGIDGADESSTDESGAGAPDSGGQRFAAALLASSPEGVLVVDAGGRVQYEGPTITTFVGDGAGELTGTELREHVPTDERALIDAVLETLRAGEPVERVECRFEPGESEATRVRIAARPAAQTSVDGHVFSLREATGPVDLVEDPDELLDRMTDVFVALDDEWRFTYFNEHALRTLGVERADAVGEVVWEQLPALQDTEVERRLREAMDAGTPETFETYFEPLDAWFEVSAYPSSAGVSVFFTDVTERVRSERALAANERAMRELHDVAADAELDFDAKVARLLQLGREHLGLALGFVTHIGDGVQEVVACEGEHDELAAGDSCPLEEAYCQETIETGELIATRDPLADGIPEAAVEAFALETYVGGRLVVEGELYGTLCFADAEPRVEPFRSSELAFVEILVQWLAYELERHRHEEQMAEQNRQLERFASIAAHDLRNPLTGAISFLEVARSTGDDDAFEEVGRSLDRMERLIDDLLWLSHEGREIGETELVDVEDVAREAWTYVPTSEAELAVEDVGTVYADRDRLLQTFENCFRNAVDHVGPDVAVGVGTLDDGFYVEDDGPGIPESERETIFESGFTTGEEGTGYGLAIVKRVAEAHGWSVAAEAGEDGGARFAFRTE